MTKSLLQSIIILLIGITLFIFGIYGRYKVNKKKTALKKVLDTVEKGSNLEKLLKENNMDKVPEVKAEKTYNIIFLCGLIMLLFGGFFLLLNMMQEGIIADIRNTLLWKLISLLVTLMFGGILIGGGILVKKRRVKEISQNDSQVKGTIVGKVAYARTLPGYGRLIVEYKDPYEDSMKRITLMQDLKLKSYPIGSNYMLGYSRTQRKAYDVQSDKLNKKLEVFMILMGILVCIAGVLYMVLRIII